MVRAAVDQLNQEDQNVDRMDVAPTSPKVNQKETKNLRRAKNQNQRNPKRVKNRRINLNAGLAVADRTNQENQNVGQVAVGRTNQEGRNAGQAAVDQINQRILIKIKDRKINLSAVQAAVDLINLRLCQNLKNPKLVKIDTNRTFTPHAVGIRDSNPHAPDRFTPSPARCAKNCGSALTHCWFGKK